jgi:hypothetical protein
MRKIYYDLSGCPIVNLENRVMNIIGRRWYVKKNPNIFLKNKDILRRGECIKNTLTKLSTYKPRKVMRVKPLILDNLFGAAQHFLLGYDISSIHHSSKSMEIGILYKIIGPTEEERRTYSEKSFWGIIKIAKERGDLTSSSATAAAERVYSRRNLFTHDAVLQQTITKVEEDWFRQKLQDVNPKLLEVTKRVFKKFDDFHSLPDLSWYVTQRSLNSSVKLIVDFLEQNIGRDLSPILEDGGQSLINKMKALTNIVQSLIKQEYDLLRYSACANIVLSELYGREIFSKL